MGWTTAIIGWNVLVYFLCLYVVRVGGQDEPIINKGAIVGRPLVLPCGLPQAKRAPPVTWVDFVNNLYEDPITIFDGSNVVASHPNAERYSVGRDYSLTIANVSETDPGEYVCRSKVGRTVNSASYIVLVAGLPRCAGETSMDEGDDLLLTCTTNYWGSVQPDVRWFRGDELVTDIVERSVISEAQYVVDTRARWQDDKLSYQCRVSVDGLAAHCEKILSVTYTVRNIQLGPLTSTSVAAGEYVTCSAKGNPEPEVTLSLKAMDLTQKGRGTQRILVANDWVGKNLTFDCEARNTVPGKDETVVASTVTLYMREKPTTTPLPTTSKRPPPKSVHSVTQPVSDLKAASAGAGDNMYVIIIGIAIGVLAVIVIIVAVICLRRRKQQDKRAAGGKNGSADSRKMEDGRRTGASEEKQPLTANHENASVSVNGEKARYSPTKA